jgi:hypothetical protein
MGRSSRDEAREQRIAMEVVVDCYGPEDQARRLDMGCSGLRLISGRASSPVADGKEGMAGR